MAYSIYKELERVLKAENFSLSGEKAAEITHNMYQMEITLPESRQTKKVLLKMDNLQNELIKIIEKYFRVSHCGKQENVIFNTNKGIIQFESLTQDSQAVAMIVEIDKY